MKIILAVLVFALCSNSFSQTDDFTTADEIDLLLRHSFFRSCQIAVDAYDLTDREIIYRNNQKMLMRPASNMKVLTSAAGLYFLEPEYKFTTQIAYDGEIDDSILIGDLYFIGGFDPDLTTNDLDTMIMELKTEGIARINGNVFSDVSKMDTLFWGQGWMWDDDPSTDFPYLSPLSINDAAVKIIVTPTTNEKKPEITSIPDVFELDYINNAITVGNDSIALRVTRDWIHNSDKIIVSGTIGVNDEPDTTKINVSNTNRYFLDIALGLLEKNGITVSGSSDTASVPEDIEVLIDRERLYSEVIVNLNKSSDNLSAEMTLRTMGYECFGKNASAKDGIYMIDSLINIIGLSPKDYRLVDGSGVSHYNLVSVELLNELLKYFYFNQEDLFEILYNSFPIGGVDGTLEYRMEDPPTFENVHAKTGTLSGVSSLAGYLTAKNGHLISFAINTQNFVGSARRARKFQDMICQILVNIDE